jgi:hypothetical protein
VIHPKRVKDKKPEIPGKNTGSEDVLYRLPFLVTQRAAAWVLQPSLLQIISSPTLISNCKPKEEFAFLRSQDFQSLFQGSKTRDP